MSPSPRRIIVGVLGVLLPCVLILSACAEDPILGPSDGESEGGGSYSVIERLAQPDTAAQSDSTDAAPVPENPERF
jgi:hypothetical protein